MVKFYKIQLKEQTPFERLFEIFKELITHTSGDFDEAIEWLRELDQEYKLTDDNDIDDFIEDLLQKSFIKQNNKGNGEGDEMSLTPKTEKLLREHALKQIFGKLKKSKSEIIRQKILDRARKILENLKITNSETH